MGVSASAITPEIEAPGSPVKDKITATGFPLKSADTKPTHSAALGGWAFGVSEYSKHKDAAAYVVMWLASRPIVTKMQTNGRKHAARLSMANDQGLLAVNPHTSDRRSSIERGNLFPRFARCCNRRVAQRTNRTGSGRRDEAAGGARRGRERHQQLSLFTSNGIGHASLALEVTRIIECSIRISAGRFRTGLGMVFCWPTCCLR
jgi:hypothetical protein